MKTERKRLFNQFLRVITLCGLLLLITGVLRQQHQAYYSDGAGYIFGRGNASEVVRAEIMAQLHQFQDGYLERDLHQVDLFMDDIISKENILVLGTMPDEIFTNPKKVSKLVYSDWNAWGDCRFLMENAHISSDGNVAWIATIGYVRFDLPRFLVLPLRLSAVLVKENLAWKFQFVQYQFDLDLFSLFLIAIILGIWLFISLVSLIPNSLPGRPGDRVGVGRVNGNVNY